MDSSESGAADDKPKQTRLPRGVTPASATARAKQARQSQTAQSQTPPAPMPHHQVEVEQSGGEEASISESAEATAPPEPRQRLRFFEQAWQILTQPKLFFERMPRSGGYVTPLGFLFLCSLTNALLLAISFLDPFLAIKSVFSSFLSVFVGAGVAWFACTKMGGKESFQATFRIFAYSKVVLLFAWIMLGKIPAGGMISVIYGAYITFIGLTTVHKVPRRNTAILVAMMLLLSLVTKKFTGI